MNFHLVYMRGGLGRLFYVNQALTVSAEKLQATINMVIPPELQQKRELFSFDSVTPTIPGVTIWNSKDPQSKACVIAIET